MSSLCKNDIALTSNHNILENQFINLILSSPKTCTVDGTCSMPTCHNGIG